MKVSFLKHKCYTLTVLTICGGISSGLNNVWAADTVRRTFSKIIKADCETDLDHKVYRIKGSGTKGLDGYYAPVRGIEQNNESCLGEALAVYDLGTASGIDTGTTTVSDGSGRRVLVHQLAQANKAAHPAIADRMIINTTFEAYSSFTYEALSILSGKRSRAVLHGREGALLQKVPVSQLYASNSSRDEDTEQEEGYFSRSARALANTPWFTVFQVHGHFGSQDKSDHVAGYKVSGYGLQGALLTPVSDNWLIGLLGGWQDLNGEIRNAEGEIDAGTFRLGPTVAWADDQWHMEALIAYNWNTIDTKETARKLDYKSNQWDGFVRGGYDVDLSGLTPGLMLTPELQILYSHQKRKDGQSPFGYLEDASSSGWTTRLGAMINYDRFELQQPVELRLAAGWQHNGFKTADLEVRGGSTKYESDYKDANSMYFSAGVDTLLNDQFNLNVSYGGYWSSKSYGHGVQAAVEFRF